MGTGRVPEDTLTKLRGVFLVLFFAFFFFFFFFVVWKLVQLEETQILSDGRSDYEWLVASKTLSDGRDLVCKFVTGKVIRIRGLISSSVKKKKKKKKKGLLVPAVSVWWAGWRRRSVSRVGLAALRKVME